jgi:hypothetical protein
MIDTVTHNKIIADMKAATESNEKSNRTIKEFKVVTSPQGLYPIIVCLSDDGKLYAADLSQIVNTTDVTNWMHFPDLPHY